MLFKKMFFSAAAICWCIPLSWAQDFILRPTPGREFVLAVSDAIPAVEGKRSEMADAIQTFNQVLWNDLSFSGFFTLAGKSYYPSLSAGAQTEDAIPYDAWAALPFPVSFLSTGAMDLRGGTLYASMQVFDLDQRKRSFGQTFSCPPDQVRAIAHQWADEVVYRLSAGASRGIASTRIAYTVKKGGAKEIYVMDYDGYNARAFTRNGSLNLYPSWSSDNSKLAFSSLKTGKWEINVYSFLEGIRLPFPVFNTHASAPALSPDGKKIAFSMRTSGGDTDIFVSDIDGSSRHNITNNPAIDSSPTWSPSGGQIAFVSSRGGAAGQIYICDADGANLRRIVKEGGDADSPSWSPDGRWLAFHWKPRLTTYYNLFLAEVSTGRIIQLTSESGSNESPSWAPDGRHLAFQSNRTGTEQIYIMLLDGKSLPIRITSQGKETTPAWGGYPNK
jgi:TolB protein